MADESKWVFIQHPEIKAPPSRVRRGAFEQHYRGKGFKEVADGEAVKAASGGSKAGKAN